MSAKRWFGAAALFTVATVAWILTGPASAQKAPELTPQDYIAIQQLVSKYAYAIDECTNRGYDYADLYVADGTFATSAFVLPPLMSPVSRVTIAATLPRKATRSAFVASAPWPGMMVSKSSFRMPSTVFAHSVRLPPWL